MPVQEARNDPHGDDPRGIEALRRRAVAEVKDLLRHADETCRTCLAGGVAKPPPETPQPRPPG